MAKRVAVLLVLSMVACMTVSRAEDSLILDETAYCRAYYQLRLPQVDPQALKTEAKQLLTPRELGVLSGNAKKFAKAVGRPWDAATWMDNARVFYAQHQGGSDRGVVDALIGTPPPSAEWAKPDFDDSAWLRQRMPWATGSLKAGCFAEEGIDAMGLFGLYYRYHFTVPELKSAGDLTLNLVYHGGIRVLLNGSEIARAHLPEGELGPETPGTVYPWQAYAMADTNGAPQRRKWGHQGLVPAYVGDLTGSFDQARVVTAQTRGANKEAMNGKYRVGRDYTRGGWYDRKTWEQTEKLRDRKLGPVTLPAKLLRAGDNVLSIEIRASHFHPIVGETWQRPSLKGNYTWYHAQLRTLTLRSPVARVPSALQRPAGVQVWVEDMHKRIMQTEFNEVDRLGVLRIVGALNGRFAAQLVVGTDKELTGLKVTPGELRLEGSKAVISGSAWQVGFLQARPIKALPGVEPVTESADAIRHGPHGYNPWTATTEQKTEVANGLCLFDQISENTTNSVPANTCQPVWLSLKVPADAIPGLYRGTVRVEGRGLPAVDVPVEADILGWKMLDPANFQTVVTLEHNPYGVAEQYGVPIWSDRHFELMESSIRHLGTIGNDYLIVPVIRNSEYGNVDKPTPIKWIRGKDGKLTFDYTVLDRYLKMAVKYWGRPRVINFLIMHGVAGKAVRVDVYDEATGKTEELNLNSNSPQYKEGWAALGTSLYAHMQSLGLAESMHWGLCWDTEGDPELPPLIVPAVPWAGATHGWGPALRSYYKYKSFIYKLAYLSHVSRKGWKRADMLVLNPRLAGTLTCIYANYDPFPFRLVVDRALVSALRVTFTAAPTALPYSATLSGSPWNSTAGPVSTSSLTWLTST